MLSEMLAVRRLQAGQPPAVAAESGEHTKLNGVNLAEINQRLREAQRFTLWQEVPTIHATSANRALNIGRLEHAGGDQFLGRSHNGHNSADRLVLGKVSRLSEDVDTTAAALDVTSVRVGWIEIKHRDDGTTIDDVALIEGLHRFRAHKDHAPSSSSGIP
jgi:hypothetical protein